jgi:hypothetical protein
MRLLVSNIAKLYERADALLGSNRPHQPPDLPFENAVPGNAEGDLAGLAGPALDLSRYRLARSTYVRDGYHI